MASMAGRLAGLPLLGSPSRSACMHAMHARLRLPCQPTDRPRFSSSSSFGISSCSALVLSHSSPRRAQSPHRRPIDRAESAGLDESEGPPAGSVRSSPYFGDCSPWLPMPTPPSCRFVCRCWKHTACWPITSSITRHTLRVERAQPKSWISIPRMLRSEEFAIYPPLVRGKRTLLTHARESPVTLRFRSILP